MTATHIYYMTNLLPQSTSPPVQQQGMAYNLRSSGRRRSVQRGTKTLVHDRLSAEYLQDATPPPKQHPLGKNLYGLVFLSTAGFLLGYVVGDEIASFNDITLEQALLIGVPTGIASLIAGVGKKDGITSKLSPKELLRDALGYSGITAGITLAGLGYGLVDRLG